MEKMFETFTLGSLTLANRFVFPPIKTAYGMPDGRVTDRHLTYYRQIAENGPGLVILEPVAVTSDGKEHPKQLCVHLPESVDELKKIVAIDEISFLEDEDKPQKKSLMSFAPFLKNRQIQYFNLLLLAWLLVLERI